MTYQPVTNQNSVERLKLSVKIGDMGFLVLIFGLSIYDFLKLTNPQPRSSNPEQFLMARAAMRASSMGRDDRMQAAGYSFNVSTDATTGDTRVESTNSSGVTTGRYFHDQHGVRIDNPFQSSLQAMGINTTDAFMDNGRFGGGVSANPSGESSSLGVWAGYGTQAITTTAVAFGADKAFNKGRIQNFVVDSFGKGFSYSRRVVTGKERGVSEGGKGKTLWASAEKWLELEKDGLATKVGGQWKTEKSAEELKEYFAQKSSFDPSRIPLTAPFNAGSTTKPRTTPAATAYQENSIGSPLSNSDKTIHPEPYDVKNSGVQPLGSSPEAIKTAAQETKKAAQNGMEYLKSSSAAEVGADMAGALADDLELNKEGLTVPQQKTREAIVKGLRRVQSNPGSSIRLTEATLAAAGIEKNALLENGFRFSGASGDMLDLTQTGEAVKKTQTAELQNVSRNADAIIDGTADLQQTVSSGDGKQRARVAAGKEAIADTFDAMTTEQKVNYAKGETAEQLQAAATDASSPKQMASAKTALAKMEEGSVSKKLLDAAGVSGIPIVEDAKGNVNFEATGETMAATRSHALRGEAAILRGEDAEGLGKAVVRNKINEAEAQGFIDAEAANGMRRDVKKGVPLSVEDMKAIGAEDFIAEKEVVKTENGKTTVSRDYATDYRSVGEIDKGSDGCV